MADPRYATLAVTAGLALFVLAVRDRRGAPPPPALEATIPAGIELVVDDGATISTRRLGRRILVGRAPSADVRIDDPRVSRLHARIEMRDDGVYVEDLGSRNGTLVDGTPVVSSRQLAPGAELTIGTAVHHFPRGRLMEIAVGSKPGTRSRGNVDAHVAEVIAPGVVLLAVAEGFGSVRGQAAPLVAALAVRDALRHRVRPDGRDARAALLSAFASANARVFAHSGSHDDFVASGSSISAALIVGDRAHIAHVGGTRAYLSRDGSLMALTTDDELGGEDWVSAWTSVPTEALTGPVLTRTLGTQATLDATVTNVRLMHGDALVLATGGFHKAITDDEISYALRTTDSSESVTQRLLETGNLRGSAFGGTVIVGRALTDAAAPVDAGPSFHIRTAALALTMLVIASLIAATVFHMFLQP